MTDRNELRAGVPAQRRPSRGRTWLESVDAIEALLKTEDRWPRRSTPSERTISMFLSKERSAARGHRGKKMHPAHRAYLDLVLPGWLLDHEDPSIAFTKNVTALRLFWARHGRPTAAMPAEGARLAGWLANQAYQVRNGYAQPDAGRQQLLDEIDPTWRATSWDVKWVTTAHALADFIAQHGRTPLNQLAETDAEQDLNHWLGCQRGILRYLHHDQFRPERRALLDSLIPGWLPPLTDKEQAWNVKADSVAEFYREHGRWPAMGATVPANERSIGAWLNNQRVAARGGKAHGAFTDERRAYLDQVVPGWLPATRPPEASNDHRWNARARELGDFMREHGRRPSMSATDKVEARLGAWAGRQRTALRMRTAAMTPEREASLDRLAPGWSLTAEELWRATAEELGTFLIAHGVLPSKMAATDDEKRLREWLMTQRKTARGGQGAGTFTSQRRATLDEVVPGWLPQR